MTAIPAQIAVDQALLRQNVALSVIKQNAQAQQQIAEILEESIQAVPASSGRGSLVNFKT